MRREIHGDPSKEFVHEESPSSSYYWCVHSATPLDLQRSTRPMFIASEMEEGNVPKKETLGDY